MSEGEAARCVYASAAAASRRGVVVYCPQAQLLCYAAASRILAYCPQSCRVVGMSQDRGVGQIVGLRVVAGPGPTTLLSLHATGAVAVWQVSPQACHSADAATVRHIFHRKFHIPDQHKGSISSGDACFTGPAAHPSLLVVTAGTDHTLRVALLCLASGSVLWNETTELRDRALVPEVRVVPLVAPSSADAAPLPLILCGGDDSKVQVWTACPAGVRSTGDPRYRRAGALPGHTDWVTALDFVYLGDTLMVASGSKDGGVRVWRFQLNLQCLLSSTHNSTNTFPQDSVSSDTTGSDESRSNNVKQLNNSHINGGSAINGDFGDKAAVLKELRVRPVPLNDVGSAVLETVLACHDGAVAHLCWLQRPGLKEQNLRLLSCTQTEDRSIVLWQPQNYCDVERSPQTSGSDDTPYEEGGVWVEGARLGEVGGNREGFFSAVFNRDGSAVYAHSYKGGVHEWRAGSQGEWVPRPTVSGHFRPVVDCSWDPLGRYLLTCSLDQTTRLHAQTSEGPWHELCRPQVHGYDMSCVACTSSLGFVAGAEEKVLRAFAGPTQLIQRLDNLCGWGTSLELQNRDFVDAAAVPSLGLSNKSLVEQNLPQLEIELPSTRPTEDTLMAGTLWPEVAKLYGHGHELMAVAASAKHIASSCKAAAPQDAAVIVWSAVTHQQLQELHHHRLTVTQLCFSSDGSKLLAVSRDRGWSVYQNQSSQNGEFALLSHSGLLGKAAQHSRIIWAAAWAPGDLAFVTASRDKTVAVWAPEETSSQETPQVWSRTATLKEEDEVTAVAVTAAEGSQWLIATGLVNGTVHVHNYSTTELSILHTTTLLPSHHSTVQRLAFRPRQDTIILASCGDDNLVCMYDCTKLVSVKL